MTDLAEIARPKRKPPQRPPYLVWSPEGTAPPVKPYATHGQALWVANDMAKRFPEQTFFGYSDLSVENTKPCATPISD